MKSTELKMTESDVAKLSFNNNASKKVHFIFFITGTVLMYSTWNKNSLFLKIVFGLFSLIGISGLFKHFFGQSKKRDLNKKIKVAINTKIINKRTIESKDHSSDEVAYKNIYRLFFENSKRYEVSKYVFDKVRVGDDTRIEYAKHSKWILKVTSNSLNMLDSNYLQKY